MHRNKLMLVKRKRIKKKSKLLLFFKGETYIKTCSTPKIVIKKKLLNKTKQILTVLKRVLNLKKFSKIYYLSIQIYCI